jgi:hypothetical protein
MAKATIKPINTMEEFVKSPWDKKITKIIASFGLQDLTDDIKQDIYLEMCTPNTDPSHPNFGKNGLQAYDPNRGAFSTYVYGLLLVKIRNARTKRMRELGVMPYSADSIADHNSDPDSHGSRAHDRLEAHGQELSNETSTVLRAEFQMQLANIKEALKKSPVRSYFFRNGECITRDLSTLLQLILEGKTREEIVEYFQYSTGSVGVMFDMLRQVPELHELKSMIG